MDKLIKKNSFINLRKLKTAEEQSSQDQTKRCAKDIGLFCHHLSDNYIDLSDLYVVLSDLYLDLSLIQLIENKSSILGKCSYGNVKPPRDVALERDIL